MKRNAAAVLTLSAIAAYASPLAISFLDTRSLGLSGSFPGTDAYYKSGFDFGESDGRPVFTLRVDNFSYSFAPSEFNWHFAAVSDTANAVPEPASLALIGLSLAALGFMHGKKRS